MRQRLFAIVFLISAFSIVQGCEPNNFKNGERLYKTYCANCHMETGEGLSALIPSLAKSDFMASNRDRLPCIIRYGLQDTIQVNGKIYAEQMPSMPSLSEIQITNLLNFVNSSWGNKNDVYSLEEVIALLEKCPKR